MSTTTLEPDVITGSSTIEGIDFDAVVPCDATKEGCPAEATHLVIKFCGCPWEMCWEHVLELKRHIAQADDEFCGWRCPECNTECPPGEGPIRDVVRL